MLAPPSLLALAFRHRSALLLLLVPPIVVRALAASAHHLGWDLAGLALAVLGVLARLWAARAIGKRARVREAGAPELITGGPYRHVRNPLYLANGAVIVGLGLLGGGPELGAGLAVGVAAIYSGVVRHEEGRLVEALGAPYVEYLASVPRWLPWPGRAAGHKSPDPWPWTSVLWRERNLAWVPVALVAVVQARAGWGPRLAASLERLGAPLGLGSEAVLCVLFAAAALANVAVTETKLRRHHRSRVHAARASSPT